MSLSSAGARSGSAVPSPLAQRGAKVTLVERGLPGAATSTLNGGGIRQQFGTATNIALALLSAPWWDTFEDRFGVDPRFQRIGYLFLGRGLAETAALQANVAAQNGSGIDSEYLDEDEIARRWPALDRCGFTGAAFRQADGWANPAPHHRRLGPWCAGSRRGCPGWNGSAGHREPVGPGDRAQDDRGSDRRRGRRSRDRPMDPAPASALGARRTGRRATA